MADYMNVKYMPTGSKYFNSYFNAFDMFQPQYSSMLSDIPAKNTINGQEISKNIGMGNFATSAHPGKDPLEELSTKIKEGATALEIGFTGQGKGSVGQGQTTPGSFSEAERHAISKLAEQNKLRLSTHASITLTGFSGLSRDQDTYGWKFDDKKRVEAEKEAEQTIDFAADTAKGGAIVIHAGEFFRDIINSPNNFEKKGGYFESYSGEREKIQKVAEQAFMTEDQLKELKEKGEATNVFHFQLGKVARADTGEIEKVYRDAPILMKKEQWGKLYGDINKMNKEISDIENNSAISILEKEQRIKEIKSSYDKDINNDIFKFDSLYENKGDNEKEKLRENIFKTGETLEKEGSGLNVGQGRTIETVEYAKILKLTNFDYGEADKLFHRLRLCQNYTAKKADMERYRGAYELARTDLEELKKSLQIQKEIENDTPEAEKYKLKKKVQRQRNDMGLIPDEYQMPTFFLDTQIKQKEEELKQYDSSLMGMQQEITMLENQLGSITKQGNLRSVAEHGLSKSADTISSLGIHAMQKWNVDLEGMNGDNLDRDKLIELARSHNVEWEGKNNEELKKELDDYALYVAPENMMPDFGPTGEPAYGGHPEELKELILKAREAMVDKLVNPQNHGVNMRSLGFDKDHLEKKEAEEYALKHIKATFDIGHANTWRKFFHGDKNSSKSEDEQFRDWLGKQVKELLDQKIIGHAHITDNFGYADDHISPGEGGAKRGAPIGDFTKLLLEAEKKGNKPIEPWIVEAGHQGVNVLFNAWHQFGHPIYRLGSKVPGPSFGFMEQSYLTSSYSSRVFNDAGLGPGQNRQVGWSGAPLL